MLTIKRLVMSLLLMIVAVSATFVFAISQGTFDLDTLIGTSFEHRFDYQYYVQPFVNDPAAFVGLLSKYQSDTSLSVKDDVDMLIQLGIVHQHPEWLTQRAIGQVVATYPSLRPKRVEKEQDLHIHLAILREDEDRMSSTPTGLETTAPAVLLGSALIAQSIKVIKQHNGNLAEHVKSNTTTVAIEQIESTPIIQEAIVNIPRISFAPRPSIVGQCTPDERGKIRNWYKEICEKPAFCAHSQAVLENEVARGRMLACILARTHAADMCFGGKFDDNHLDQIGQNHVRINKCDEIIFDQRSKMSSIERTVDDVTSTVARLVD